MKRNRKLEERIKRINHVRIAVFAVIIILTVVVGMSIKSVLELSIEQHELKKENADLKEQKAALEREFQNINDKSYIEEQARKQLNMVKPGEIVYIIEEDENAGRQYGGAASKAGAAAAKKRGSSGSSGSSKSSKNSSSDKSGSTDNSEG